MSSIFRSIAPLALSFLAPGLGTAIGSALGAGASFAPIVGSSVLGAGLGAAGGGGLEGAGVGALTGGLSGGGGESIAKAFGAAPGAAAKGLGTAISSGVGTAASGGDLGDVLTNAALSGGANYAMSGGNVPGLGSVQGSTLDVKTGVPGMQGPTQGSGVLGKLTSLTNTDVAGGSQPMKLGSLLSAGGDIYGYMQGEKDLDNIKKMMEQQSAMAQQQYQPYAQAGQQALSNMQAPDLEALQNDPGYQFRLQQGNQALDRQLAARGMGRSGAAMKAAQQYGQGLADQTYNDYFNRQGQLANMGYNASSGLGSIYSNLGNVQGAAELERMNQRNKMLSGLGGLFG